MTIPTPSSTPSGSRASCRAPGNTSSQADQPKEAQTIKHVTPTHFTWVAYDREKNAVLALAGGTWSLKDGKYEESIEFSSDNVQHLRGKVYQFTINLAGDKWDHKGVPDSEIDVDQVWMRHEARGSAEDEHR